MCSRLRLACACMDSKRLAHCRCCLPSTNVPALQMTVGSNWMMAWQQTCYPHGSSAPVLASLGGFIASLVQRLEPVQAAHLASCKHNAPKGPGGSAPMYTYITGHPTLYFSRACGFMCLHVAISLWMPTLACGPRALYTLFSAFSLMEHVLKMMTSASPASVLH